ncbi:MAG: Bax inhibitor-1/YccA family protein [Vulcanimicrobiota bacterium]
MALRSGNPALNANTFTNITDISRDSGTMTIEGTVNRSFLLLFLLMMSAGFVWKLFLTSATNPGAAATVNILMIAGIVGGLIFSLITIFVKTLSPYTSPIYAIFEGLFIGGISAMLEAAYPGIVIQAVALTGGTLLALLMAYKMRIVKATENFKLGIVAATGGICLIYVLTLVLGFFNIQIPYIHQSGPIGILFSLFVVVIAALNLVLDFDFIEQGAASGAPKYMEWYGAFGLMVTLVWLYIEILRLLTKLRSRD